MFARILFSLFFFVAVGAVQNGVQLRNEAQTPNYEQMFNDWSVKFRIQFHDATHREYAFRNWVSNHLFIEQSNSQGKLFTLGHNQFSGMNSTEFVQWVRGGVDLANVEFFRIGSFDVPSSELVASVPSSIDWTAKGAVTPVKDQGQCGSCWSFSTTGALEGAFAIKSGTLASFSEQQLVDCDTLGNGGRDHGCGGGLMDNAFNWIMKNNGLCTESDYPYVSGTTMKAGTCQTSCKNVGGSDIIKYVDVEPNSDLAMMTAVAQQPVSVAIEADQREFQLYKSGVFTGACGTNLDHGVLVVGYGTQSGTDYYKIKNSWSSSWGENGYIRIGRGSSYNKGSGQCGVLMQASYPIV